MKNQLSLSSLRVLVPALAALSSLSGCAYSSVDSEPSDSDIEESAVGEVEEALSSCVTIQNAAQGSTSMEDAYITTDAADPSKANANFGGVIQMSAGTVGSEYRRVLMKFDVLGAGIPAGSTVTSASLALTIAQSPGKGALNFYDVTVPWTESQVTWNQLAAAPNQGLGALQATAATLGIPGNGTLTATLPTALVSNWLNPAGAPNNGIVIDHPSAGRSAMGASEAPLASYRPKLTICYDAPTCSDGIQNQGETGLDCGGVNCAPCPGGLPTGTTVWSHAFIDTVNYTPQTVTYGVDMDASGNTLTLGTISGPVDLGGGMLPQPSGVGITFNRFDPTGLSLASSLVVQNDPATGIYGGVGVGSIQALPGGGAIFTVTAYVPLDIGGVIYTPVGGSDVILVRVDDAGSVVSVTQYANPGDEGVNSLDVSASGEVILTMQGNGPADFGGGPLDSAAANDFYVVKLNPALQYAWGQVYGASGAGNYAVGAFHPTGDVILGVTSTGPHDFGGGSLGGSYGSSLVRLTGGGAHVWSKFLGAGIQLGAVRPNALGDVFLSAIYGKGVSVNLGGSVLTGVASSSMLVARYTGAGNHIYSIGFGITDPIVKPHTSPPMNVMGAPRLVADGQGNVFLSGMFQGDANLGGGVFSAGWSTLGYRAKFDPNGIHLWSTFDSGSDFTAGIAGNATGNIAFALSDSWMGTSTIGTFAP